MRLLSYIPRAGTNCYVGELIQLGLEHFLPCDQLPPLTPEATPKFVRTSWLDMIAEICLESFWDCDGASASVQSRVALMAFVAHSGGGKTRSMMEILRRLQIKLRIAVIFISFNNNTPYSKNEAQTIWDSVLSRIAYYISTDEAKQQKKLHDADGKLQFVSSKEAILEWLSNNPCILAIDEFNRWFTPQKPTPHHEHHQQEVDRNGMFEEVARFLKDTFLRNSGRFLMISSHVLSTTRNLKDFMDCPTHSDRRVDIQSLPVFKSMQEINAISRQRVHVAMYAFSPAMTHLAGLGTAFIESRVVSLVDMMDPVPQASAVTASLFSDSCCTQKELDPMSQFEPITRVETDANGDRIRIWIPCFLEPLYANLPGLSQSNRQSARNVLAGLGAQKVGSGQSWEQLVLCALFFRILSVALTPGDHPPDQRWRELVPKLPSGVFDIRVVFFGGLLAEVVAELKSYSAQDTGNLYLCHPSHSCLGIYDILLAVTHSGCSTQIWGYQCKGKELPDHVPVEGITSIFLRSRDVGVKSSASTRAGWIGVNVECRNNLLGPTFLRLVLLETEMEEQGGAAMEDEDADL
jgi:hypothetical protein